jgi:hypothetical protein
MTVSKPDALHAKTAKFVGAIQACKCIAFIAFFPALYLIGTLLFV